MNNIATTMSLNLMRQDIQSMHAYAIQDSTGMVKLDAMENPYTLSADLQAKLGERLGKLAINRYPGTRIEDLKTKLRTYAQVPADYGLMLGNGSDELISLLAMACALPDAKVLAPLPGFVMYEMSAKFQGSQFIGVPLRADFELDEPAMLAAIAKNKPAITYIAYPNNPTGTLWDEAAIKNIIAACATYGGLVVMDEAYQPFSAKSWITQIHNAPEQNTNVLLMRTLSKFGLAGVRIGYMMGHAALVGEVDKLRPPYNISILNCECALFALEHEEVFRLQAFEILAQRAMLLEALAKIPGVQAMPSEANIILVRVQGKDSANNGTATRVFAGMKAHKVLIKNVSNMHPLLANCIRLSVGTPAENQQMLAALQASM